MCNEIHMSREDHISMCNIKNFIFLDSTKNRSPEDFRAVRFNFYSNQNCDRKIFFSILWAEEPELIIVIQLQQL
jgi:hypothetical protein